jgi:hypothetical protein
MFLERTGGALIGCVEIVFIPIFPFFVAQSNGNEIFDNKIVQVDAGLALGVK